MTIHKNNEIISNFYLIREDNKPTYVGYTNRSIKQRFTEHLHDKDFMGDATVEELDSLSFPFTWDINTINQYAKQVSHRESELIEEYGTGDSIWQKGINGNIGGQTWANVKNFVLTNKDNPKFKGMPDDIIIELVEYQRKMIRYLRDVIDHTKPLEDTRLKNVIRHTNPLEDIRLKNVIRHTNPLEDIRLKGIINSTKPLEYTRLRNVINGTKHLDEIRLRSIIHDTNPLEYMRLRNVISNTKPLEYTRLRNIIIHTKPLEDTRLKSAISNTKPLEYTRLRNVIHNTKPLEDTRLRNVIHSTKCLDNKTTH